MATKPGSRQLSWLPNNLFDTGGMPAWLATAFDTDERRAEFTKWMGDMFTQWTRGQAVTTEANAAAITANQRKFLSQPATGRYFSQRQLEEVFNPEDRAARLERLRFHGGMANGKWTNDYDTWKAASKNGHGTNSRGEEIKTGSFGFSVETARDRAARAAGFNRGFFADHAVESAWTREKAATAGGDRRGVRLGEDGSLELHFGDTGVKTDVTAGRSATANAARRRMEILTNTDPQNEDWMFDGSNTDFSDRKRFADLFAASKGGDTMRDRGWLDAVFNGGLTRAALRGGRSRK